MYLCCDLSEVCAEQRHGAESLTNMLYAIFLNERLSSVVKSIRTQVCFRKQMGWNVEELHKL